MQRQQQGCKGNPPHSRGGGKRLEYGGGYEGIQDIPAAFHGYSSVQHLHPQDPQRYAQIYQEDLAMDEWQRQQQQRFFELQQQTMQWSDQRSEQGFYDNRTRQDPMGGYFATDVH